MNKDFDKLSRVVIVCSGQDQLSSTNQ